MTPRCRLVEKNDLAQLPTIGMEEESLIRTCQDVGIIFQQRSYHFEYKEGDKGVVIAQGLENTIRKL